MINFLFLFIARKIDCEVYSSSILHHHPLILEDARVFIPFGARTLNPNIPISLGFMRPSLVFFCLSFFLGKPLDKFDKTWKSEISIVLAKLSRGLPKVDGHAQT